MSSASAMLVFLAFPVDARHVKILRSSSEIFAKKEMMPAVPSPPGRFDPSEKTFPPLLHRDPRRSYECEARHAPA